MRVETGSYYQNNINVNDGTDKLTACLTTLVRFVLVLVIVFFPFPSPIGFEYSSASLSTKEERPKGEAARWPQAGQLLFFLYAAEKFLMGASGKACRIGYPGEGIGSGGRYPAAKQ